MGEGFLKGVRGAVAQPVSGLMHGAQHIARTRVGASPMWVHGAQPRLDQLRQMGWMQQPGFGITGDRAMAAKRQSILFEDLRVVYDLLVLWTTGRSCSYV